MKLIAAVLRNSLLVLLCACSSEAPARKVALVGIDGAAWWHLDPLIQEGLLPNLARVRKTGATADLQIDSSLSPVSWTTIATGKHPNKHGVLDQETPGQTFAANSELIKVKRAWDIASGLKRQVFVFQYWLTHPAYAINGVMVAHQTSDTWPRDLNRENGEIYTGKPELNAEMLRLGVEFGASGMINQILDSHPDFDLLMVPYYAWDNGMHRLFDEYVKGADPAEVARLDATTAARIQLGHRIGRETLILADKLVGRLIDYVGPDGYVVLVSDHGHRLGPLVQRRLALNRGILDGQRGTIEQGVLPFPGGEIRVQRVEEVLSRPHPTLTYQRSYPTLTVTGEKAAAEIAWLLELKDSSGAPIFADNGGGVLRPSDAVLAALETSLGGTENSYFSVFVNAGSHSMDDPGVFGILGPGVQSGKITTPVSTVDVTPTLLWLLGLPAAEDMDGRPVTAAFSADHLKEHAVKLVPTFEDGTRPWAAGGVGGLSVEEAERLKALGYIQK